MEQKNVRRTPHSQHPLIELNTGGSENGPTGLSTESPATAQEIMVFNFDSILALGLGVEASDKVQLVYTVMD